ncbi:MAG: VWA domain-containing protein [Alphaproteobacteria bacterium]|nr:MAG: VWA domain-containing protein [Alphaproteobacteria bacterium]
MFFYLKRFAAIVGASILLTGWTVTPDKAALSARVEMDHPKVLRGYEGPIYVLIDLEAIAKETSEDETRPDLNLGLVLDRSGSMEDAGKMDYLKRAAGMAVDQLTPKDLLSIVEYDDQINVLWPIGRVESAYTIKHLINGLAPRGSTNLTGGMMRGVEEVGSAETGEAALSRVLLLSDGLANQGITDPRQIKELVREARLKGVRISTLGLGRDYDEDLMQMIAEHGGGHYYYIENPNQMGRIFQEELATLFTTVAREAALDVDVTSKVEAIELVSFSKNLTKSGGRAELSDFYGGETRTLVLRIEPEKDAFKRRGKVSLGEIKITYKDVESGKTVSLTSDLKVEVVTQQAAVDAAINKDVVVETTLLETERKHREAVSLYEQGQIKEAEEMMTSLAGSLTSINETIQDKRLEQKVDALKVENDQMAEVAAAPEAKEGYIKRSKQRLYQAQSGKRNLYVLEEGDKGLEVENLQKALKDKGYFEGDVDGIFSSELKAAVEAFQNDEGLDVDGIAGPTTQKALGLY